jgi:Amt family ammonium transporter
MFGGKLVGAALGVCVVPFLLLPAEAAASDRALADAAAAGARVSKPAAPTSPLDSGNIAWMLTSSALVLMMTGPGLALFYAGLVRKKNVLGTMMQSFAMMALVSLQWYAVGYSVAFHEGTGCGGLDWAFLRGSDFNPACLKPDPYGYAGTIPIQLHMVYQLMFAIITPALICGAFAERMKFSAMAIFLVAWATLVYDPLAHWVWGKGGWLRYGDDGAIVGALDFAGGTVVHISSGVSALVCALMLGKRKGFPQEPMPPHNLTYSFVGACLLWVGWFGFNAGSALESNALAVSAFCATHFATAAAALAWAGAEWFTRGKPSVLGGISGAVAGLVAITPASGYVTIGAAILIGLAGGFLCFCACTAVKNQFGYDDSLDAFGVHGVGGTVGAILTGVFAWTHVNSAGADGLLHSEGDTTLLVNQIIAAAATWALAAVATFVILSVLKLTIGLRVSDQHEIEGLDLSQHGEVGYNL